MYRFRRSNNGDDVGACRGDDHERRRDCGRRRREAEDQIVEISVVGEPARPIGVDRHRVGDGQNPRQEREADDDAQSSRHGPGAYAGRYVEVHRRFVRPAARAVAEPAIGVQAAALPSVDAYGGDSLGAAVRP